MSDSETEPDTPSLAGGEEVVRIADDHRGLEDEWAPRGNIVPFHQSNVMEQEPSQISSESPRKTPTRTLPEVGNPYQNPRVYNPYRHNLDRYRTGDASREEQMEAGGTLSATSRDSVGSRKSPKCAKLRLYQTTRETSTGTSHF